MVSNTSEIDLVVSEIKGLGKLGGVLNAEQQFHTQLQNRQFIHAILIIELGSHKDALNIREILLSQKGHRLHTKDSRALILGLRSRTRTPLALSIHRPALNVSRTDHRANQDFHV